MNPTLESTPRPSIITTDQTQIKLVNQIEIKSESNPLQNPLETHNQLQNPPQLPSKLTGNPQLASQPSGNPHPEQQPIPRIATQTQRREITVPEPVVKDARKRGAIQANE